jgi:hypothetical protein
MPGPPPKDPALRRRRNKQTRVELEASSDKSPSGPALEEGFAAETVAWFETWRSSPQSQAFTVTDWQRLKMLAPLVDRYFAEPSLRLMAEIRMNETLLGATIVDRLRAHMSIQPASPSIAKPVATRRERLRVV